MNPLTIDDAPDLHDDDAVGERLPGRPRRRLLNRITGPLLTLLFAAAGFLVGIEVEKGHGAGASSTARPSLASAAAGSAKPSGSGFGSFSGGAPGGAGGFGGGGTTGTISSVSGRTIYLKTTSGDTIEVQLTSATTLKKDLGVKRAAIRPGDSITVDGITGSGGSIKASSVSDSGDASTSSGSGTSSSSGTS
jgi:hypothetical protein